MVCDRSPNRTKILLSNKKMNVKSLIDTIKACIRNGAPDEEVRRLGALYLEAHNKATKRLQRCVDLIRQEKNLLLFRKLCFHHPL